MPKRNSFHENAYYHVYNRGLHKQTIFYDQRDFQRFAWYMQMYQERCSDKMKLVAYCLLPNHFHFVVCNMKEGHGVSYFVGNVCASYVRYYKAKYGYDSGLLFFESRFKAKHIEDDDYLKQCIYYVENNALKHDLVDDAKQRAWRSESSVDGDGSVLDRDWEF